MLHPARCTVFARNIVRCGNLNFAAGVSFDRQSKSNICFMTAPQPGSDLQLFICEMRLTLVGIAEFSTIWLSFARSSQGNYTDIGTRNCLAAGCVLLNKTLLEVGACRCVPTVKERTGTAINSHTRRF